MAGGIIIGDILAPFPSLKRIPERVMLLKDLKTKDGIPVEDPDPNGPTARTINGLFKPRWRCGRVSSSSGESAIKARTSSTSSASAAKPFTSSRPTATFRTARWRRRHCSCRPAPGSRCWCTDRHAARTSFRTRRSAPARRATNTPASCIMTVVSKGSPVAHPIPIPPPSAFPKLPDLRNAKINQHRTIVFADTADPNLFYIDGKPYNPDCVDTVVKLGDIEEWTIQNTAQEAHVFHIHQLDFQVTEVNGKLQPFDGYHDVVTLPAAASDVEPSAVKILIPFTDPVIVGRVRLSLPHHSTRRSGHDVEHRWSSTRKHRPDTSTCARPHRKCDPWPCRGKQVAKTERGENPGVRQSRNA